MQYYRTLERTFTTNPGARLRITNRSGELTVVGEDRTDITLTVQFSVDAENQREGEARLEAIQLPIGATDDFVEIGPPEFDDRRANSSVLGMVISKMGFSLGGTRVNMIVRVPRDCAVTAEQRSGPLRISGLRRGVRAISRSGHCEVSDIEGPVGLESRSGTTEIRQVRGELVVEGRSGRIEIERVHGDATIANRSGNVIVRELEGAVRLAGRAGRVQLTDIAGPVDVQAHSGGVELRGRIQWPVSIELHSGHVKLAVTRDSMFFMDAETNHGSIRSELPVDYLDQPPGDAPTVRVRTHAGTVRVVAA